MLSKRETELMLKQIDGHIFALKNWIASRVEQSELTDAQRLVAELRECEEIRRKLKRSLRDE